MFWPRDGSAGWVSCFRKPASNSTTKASSGRTWGIRCSQLWMAQFCAWFIYRTKKKQQGLLEWKSNVLGLAMRWEWNWSCCSGERSGSGRRAGFSSGALKWLQPCPEPHNSSPTSVLAMLLLWEVVQKNSAKEEAGICKSQKPLNSNGISKA